MRTLLRRPRSLTARLVTTAVLLVASVCLVVTGATAAAMQQFLLDRLDQQVAAALLRATGPDGGGFVVPGSVGPPADGRGPGRGEPPGAVDDGDADDDGDGGDGGGDDGGRRGPDLRENLLGQGGGTLVAFLPGDGAASGEPGRGLYVPFAGGATTALDAETLRTLQSVPVGRGARTVGVEPTLDGAAGAVDDDTPYRVLAATRPDGSVLVVGLPTTEVVTTVRTIVLAGLALTLAGVAVAGVGGRLLVRRQLQPLREVAATAAEVSDLPLGSGRADVRPRVPAALADGRTEVGQVGAALNTLLGHVAEALDERHRSEQRVRQFVADASHELRTPLTTIAGYAQLARRSPEDLDGLRLALARVEDQSVRMQALVEDLLLLARLDSGRPLERGDVDLARLVVESVGDARVIAPGHVWRLDLPDGEVVVPGDALRLQQVVTNLLTNAARHTPPGTTVTARAALDEDGRRALIEVRDDGPGLAPDLAAHAFERFTRGDSSRTRASGGAGLGLSLVKAIVEAHDGRVGVRSGGGTTSFTVHLPRSSESPPGV